MEKCRVSEEGAIQFLNLAKESRNWKNRDIWLWAYWRYDFKEADDSVQQELKRIADMFHRLNHAWRK